MGIKLMVDPGTYPMAQMPADRRLIFEYFSVDYLPIVPST